MNLNVLDRIKCRIYRAIAGVTGVMKSKKSKVVLEQESRWVEASLCCEYRIEAIHAASCDINDDISNRTS